MWFRYPDADINLAMKLALHAGDGDNKARLTRKSAKKTVKTIAQGRPDVPANLW